MIKNLKLKFMLIIISIISLIMIGILIAINLIVNNNIHREIFDSMKKIADNDGTLLKPAFKISDDNPSENQAFNLTMLIKLDKENNILEIIYPYESKITYTVDEISEILKNVFLNESKSGEVDNVSFFKEQKSYGYIVVLMEITSYNKTRRNLLYTSFGAFIFSLIITFIISYFLSEWLIKPIKQNLEMQKQFIANASHELKTPLSVISMNISILNYENDFNEQKKWIENAKNEVFKMNDLVNKLLTLSKTEIISNNNCKQLINISDIILNCILSYESILLEKNQILNHYIEQNIFLKASEEDISTIVRIFLDNAIKYSSATDIIEIKLKNKHDHISFSIFNTGIGIKTENIQHIFDRFYRVDTSRNKEIEGYGLGLSIAKNIIDNNNWKIKTESVYESWVKFTITF